MLQPMADTLTKLADAWNKYAEQLNSDGRKAMASANPSILPVVTKHLSKVIAASSATGKALDALATAMITDISWWSGIVSATVTLNTVKTYREQLNKAGAFLDNLRAMQTGLKSGIYPPELVWQQMTLIMGQFLEAINYANEYFDSIWHKVQAGVAGLFQAALDVLLAGAGALKTGADILAFLLKALPWVVVGIGAYVVWRRVQRGQPILRPAYDSGRRALASGRQLLRDRKGRKVVDVDAED